MLRIVGHSSSVIPHTQICTGIDTILMVILAAMRVKRSVTEREVCIRSLRFATRVLLSGKSTGIEAYVSSVRQASITTV